MGMTKSHEIHMLANDELRSQVEESLPLASGQFCGEAVEQSGAARASERTSPWLQPRPRQVDEFTRFCGRVSLIPRAVVMPDHGGSFRSTLLVQLPQVRSSAAVNEVPSAARRSEYRRSLRPGGRSLDEILFSVSAVCLLRVLALPCNSVTSLAMTMLLEGSARARVRSDRGR